MKLSRKFRTALLCCAAVCGLTLCGCGSSRSSVKGSQGKVVRNERKGDSGRQPYTSTPVSTSGIDDQMARDLISEANRWLGTPYSYGGTTTGGTDCSGLVMSLYRDVTGVKIPRTTREQVRYCTNLARNKIRPGDLVFFANGKEVSHVGLYVGNGSMIHASSSRGVIVSDIDSGYWARRYLTGGRVEPARESWASLNGNRRGKKKAAPAEPAAPAGPPEAPSQLLYNHGEMAAASPRPASTAPSIPASQVGDILAASSAPAPGHPTPPTTPSSPTSPSLPTPSSVSEIDLLDLIITQKTDSIFSSQFLD